MIIKQVDRCVTGETDDSNSDRYITYMYLFDLKSALADVHRRTTPPPHRWTRRRRVCL